jgi:hypothetical protein
MYVTYLHLAHVYYRQSIYLNYYIILPCLLSWGRLITASLVICIQSTEIEGGKFWQYSKRRSDEEPPSGRQVRFFPSMKHGDNNSLQEERATVYLATRHLLRPNLGEGTIRLSARERESKLKLRPLRDDRSTPCLSGGSFPHLKETQCFFPSDFILQQHKH